MFVLYKLILFTYLLGDGETVLRVLRRCHRRPCPRRLRGGGVQQGGEQQDECRPRRAEEMNGSVHVHVHFCFINLFIHYSIYWAGTP